MDFGDFIDDEDEVWRKIRRNGSFLKKKVFEHTLRFKYIFATFIKQINN